MIRTDVTYTIKSGCIRMDKTENSEITSMSYDIPMVSIRHNGPTMLAPQYYRRAVILYS